MNVLISVARQISTIGPTRWDRLEHGPSPFLKHGFIEALEASGSIGEGTGWDPYYIVAHSGDSPEVVGAVACFRKTHSYGEYIFDFAWSSASARSGIPYYPKLVIAVPVTPVSGPRILLAPGLADRERDLVVDALCRAVRELADELGCWSIHWLFTTEQEHQWLQRAGFKPRSTFQFHWSNRGYAGFDDFLAALKSRKRKQIRKERARAAQAVAEIRTISGQDFDRDDLTAMERFYRSTTRAHGGTPYLHAGFFAELHKRMPENMMLVRASDGAKIIAGASYLHTPQALYGRYWGCTREHEFLHFELAYYRGIEWAIGRGIPLFEAGAQGEQKLLRGFEPRPTYSSHWMRHSGLANAVDRYLAEEKRAMHEHMRELATYLPYRSDGGERESC